MIINIQKAMELTGLSRSTIQRAIKSGKLSKTEQGIDTSELARVYQLKSVIEPVKTNQAHDAMVTREQFLIKQIELLTNQLDLANDREKRLMALLENQSKHGLFDRFFGK